MYSACRWKALKKECPYRINVDDFQGKLDFLAQKYRIVAQQSSSSLNQTTTDEEDTEIVSSIDSDKVDEYIENFRVLRAALSNESQPTRSADEDICLEDEANLLETKHDTDEKEIDEYQPEDKQLQKRRHKKKRRVEGNIDSDVEVSVSLDELLNSVEAEGDLSVGHSHCAGEADFVSEQASVETLMLRKKKHNKKDKHKYH